MSGSVRLHLLLSADRGRGRSGPTFKVARQGLEAGFAVLVWPHHSWPASLPDDEVLGSLREDRRFAVARDGTVLGDGDFVLVGGMPAYRQAVRLLEAGMSRERIVHVVNDARSADPTWRDGVPLRLLTRPAARISTDPAVAAAIVPWLDPRGLHRTVTAGDPARATGEFFAELGERVQASEARSRAGIRPAAGR